MTIYDFTETTITGESISMEKYKGKVLLIVNVASKCGFTPQYEGLEAMYKDLGEKGLEILGFPCNQFKEQEPGSDSEVAAFCRATYGVTFPMFSKIDVNGENADPLYVYLRSQKGFAGFDPTHKLTTILQQILIEANPNYKNTDDIKWNFTKFLVDRNGTVVRRFEPTTELDVVRKEIEAIL